MEDPRWLRLMTIGLVLAALAVGYFILSGAMSPKPASKDTQVKEVVSTTIPLSTTSPSPSVLGQNSQTVSPTPSPMSAFDTISNRTKGGIAQTQTQALPRTGFPLGLAVVISVSTIVSGLVLRKYPH